ncbi:hypothetical protein OG738_44050 [Amycolatopsis sp. NBC_01488]|uniref:hypothetical protein n=1 Tax=Amycolatopsis sp. NBC_01488 TaxID=2903563 RepID=UPI002E2DE24B|nr:hypothetical protein [Amycolatopsis sp. NBC_01488]
MADYGYYCGDSRYRDADVRRDAAMPSGFTPEAALPPAFRRAERLRSREVGYQLAEALPTHGAPMSVAAALMEVPHHVPARRRQAWREREARLCGDARVCSMPVTGCRAHGDTLAWRKGAWRCTVPTCRSVRAVKDQRRHCPEPAVALIDYPSGHHRRLCAGHLVSERTVWAAAPVGATMRVTPTLHAVAGPAGAGR